MYKRILAAVFSLLLCTQLPARQLYRLYFNKKTLHVELAADSRTRQQGLMYRKFLSPGCGMLFVFDIPARYGFWMKNTYIPLSIAFLDQTRRIISISPMKPHELSPVYSRGRALYAVEAKKGWFRKNGIKIGMKVRFGKRLLKKLGNTSK